MSEISLYNRATKQLETEIVLGDAFVKLAYETPAKHILSWPMFAHAIVSRILGWYANTNCSKNRIQKTVRDLNIDMDDFIIPEQGFTSFNDFFARKIKPDARTFDGDESIIASPADCRMIAWQKLDGNTCIPAKGANFTLDKLLGPNRRNTAEQFEDGSLCVCRLCPADYHRYHYPANGKTIEAWPIKGKYHSVNPIALRQNLDVFTTNYRTVSILELDACGIVAYIEVGAFGVASIIQTHNESNYRKGDEKGYFAFGGSTIIMVFQNNRIQFDQDIIEYSKQGIETRILAGNQIATIQ